MQGGAHALVSVVRVRLSSASSVPLKRAQSAAPSARPALDSPLCARDATVQLDCSSSTNSSSETRRGLELSSAEVSTEPDPDGRLVRRPESRRSADLTSFGTKGQISTYLRLDHVGAAGPGRRAHPPPGGRAYVPIPGPPAPGIRHPCIPRDRFTPKALTPKALTSPAQQPPSVTRAAPSSPLLRTVQTAAPPAAVPTSSLVPMA